MMSTAEFTNLTLLISERAAQAKECIEACWRSGGGSVLRLDRFWEPPSLNPASIRLYGNKIFCLELSRRLNLVLTSPPDDFLFRIPSKLVKRDIQKTTLRKAARFEGGRVFLKPLQQKLFAAGIFSSPEELAFQCYGLEESTEVIAAEPVEFLSEFRLFVLHGQVVAHANYFGDKGVFGLSSFVRDLLAQCDLPTAAVVDVGYIARRGWAVIEANPAWGAAPRGCSPEEVARCVAFATQLRRSSLVE